MIKNYYEELIDKPYLVEKFVKYYGERARSKIEYLFYSTCFVLVPYKVKNYEFRKFIIKKYPQLIKFDNLEIITHIMNYINNSNYDSSLSIYFTDSIIEDVLKEFNINELYNEHNPFEDILNDLSRNFISLCKKINNEKSHKLSSNYKETLSDINKISDLILKNVPYEKWKPEFSSETVRLFNKLFNTRHPNWESVLKDKKYKFILCYLNSLNEKFNHLKYNNLLKDNNELVDDLIKLINSDNICKGFSTDDIVEAYTHFTKNSVGFTKRCIDNFETYIFLPLSDSTCLEALLHELHHLFSIQPFNYNLGFKSERDDYEELNEIINQYLTLDMMKTLDFSSLNFPVDRKMDSEYNKGVEILKPFLDEYKEIIINLLNSNHPMDLKSKMIGDKNFNKLSEYAKFLLSSDYNTNYFNLYSKLIKKSINSANDIILNAEELKLKLKNLANNNHITVVNTLVDIKNFTNTLIENKHKFINRYKSRTDEEFKHVEI